MDVALSAGDQAAIPTGNLPIGHAEGAGFGLSVCTAAFKICVSPLSVIQVIAALEYVALPSPVDSRHSTFKECVSPRCDLCRFLLR